MYKVLIKGMEVFLQEALDDNGLDEIGFEITRERETIDGFRVYSWINGLCMDRYIGRIQMEYSKNPWAPLSGLVEDWVAKRREFDEGEAGSAFERQKGEQP